MQNNKLPDFIMISGGSQACDYKAAAVYTRSAFEKIIQKYCEKKRKSLRFKSCLKDYTSENFWDAMKSDLNPATLNAIEAHRSLVLNTFSHDNTEKHEIKTELQDAIQAVDTLKIRTLVNRNIQSDRHSQPQPPYMV